MTTKTELVNELARLTGETKVSFKSESKEKLIILLHETRKKKNYPTHGKHVWLGTPRKRRKSRRQSRRKSTRKHNKHVWIVSPRSRPKRRRNSRKRRKSPRRSSPRRTSRSRSRRKSRRKSPRRRHKSVSWGGKHVKYGSPAKKKRSRGRAGRSSMKAKRSYRTSITSPKRRRSSSLTRIASWKRAYTSKGRRSRRVRSPTKKSYVDELARITGKTKKYYNSFSKPELAHLLDSTKDERWTPKHGKHVWLSTPPKRSRRRSNRRSRKNKHVYLGTPPKRSKRSRRKRSRRKRSRRKRSRHKRSKKKVYKPCKSYQERVNGRCRNKPCKKDKIRDRVTKKCRKKKSGKKR